MTSFQQRIDEEQALVDRLLSRLSPRERQVLTRVAAGRLNKQIASEFGIVEKTVKVHRNRVKTKLGLQNAAELVRFAVWAGLQPNVCPLPIARVDLGPTPHRQPV